MIYSQVFKQHIAFKTTFLEPTNQNCSTRFFEFHSSNDVASGSELTPCIKIDKPLVVYRFLGNVMTSITTLCTLGQNNHFFTQEMGFQSIFYAI